MKPYILTLLFCMLAVMSQAQQTPLFSQYMTNYYLLNPAAAGAEESIVFKAGYRMQWVGFEGAPSTYYLSGHLPLQAGSKSRKKSGLGGYHAAGGYVYGDKTGPISRTGINASYAYHLPISKDITTSVGLTVGAQQYAFNADKLHLADDSNDLDPVTAGGSRSALVPDISLGYYIQGKQFYAGVSLAQALGNKIFAFDKSDLESNSKLSRHMYVSGSYTFPLNDKISLAPSTLLKYATAAPIQADLHLRALYTLQEGRGQTTNDGVWLGFTYRTEDALVALLGVQLLERYELNYSYDYTLSPLKNHSAGSHEIALGLRLLR